MGLCWDLPPGQPVLYLEEGVFLHSGDCIGCRCSVSLGLSCKLADVCHGFRHPFVCGDEQREIPIGHFHAFGIYYDCAHLIVFLSAFIWSEMGQALGIASHLNRGVCLSDMDAHDLCHQRATCGVIQILGL